MRTGGEVGNDGVANDEARQLEEDRVEQPLGRDELYQ
tara:strand:+ start:389 stop:499 length:111 start_codon:yes stop_codon:yes gene_type:complete